LKSELYLAKPRCSVIDVMIFWAGQLNIAFFNQKRASLKRSTNSFYLMKNVIKCLQNIEFNAAPILVAKERDESRTKTQCLEIVCHVKR
jgi:hypothetical protein